MSTEKKVETEDKKETPAAASETKAPAPAAAAAAAKKATAKLYVVTEKVRSGRLRDSAAHQTFTANAPVEAVLREGSWLDSQVKAGLIKEFQS